MRGGDKGENGRGGGLCHTRIRRHFFLLDTRGKREGRKRKKKGGEEERKRKRQRESSRRRAGFTITTTWSISIASHRIAIVNTNTITSNIIRRALMSGQTSAHATACESAMPCHAVATRFLRVTNKYNRCGVPCGCRSGFHASHGPCTEWEKGKFSFVQLVSRDSRNGKRTAHTRTRKGSWQAPLPSLSFTGLVWTGS
jgi:hypothetical protein